MKSVAPSVTGQAPLRDGQKLTNKAQLSPAGHGYSAFYRFVRKTHLWVAIIVALPLLLRLVTGIALQIRKPADWLQPATETGIASYEPAVTHEQVLAAVRAIPEMRVESWEDLALTDYRPGKGIIKVRNHNELETQVDATTGDVIKTGQRRNELMGRIHDGSEWGMRIWFFFPAALLIVYLCLSGFYLAVVETARELRAKARRRKPRGANSPSPARRRRFNLVQFCLRYHYWLALVVVLPWLLVTASGMVLQLRYELPGVDPGLRRGTGSAPMVSYARVLDISLRLPELGVKHWRDIWRVYTHPGQGVITVRTTRGVRAQIDARTGVVLAVESFSRDFWEDLHQGIVGRYYLRSGKPFGDIEIDLHLWVFLPVHLVSVFLWLTGVIYFLQTTFAKKKTRRRLQYAHVSEYPEYPNARIQHSSTGAD